MERAKTLFQILGVSPRATDEQVHRRWLRHVTKAHGEDRVAEKVRYAYRVLAKASQRKQYADLLDACYKKTPLTVETASLAGLRTFCRSLQISVEPDPDPEMKGWFHFRLPHQDPFCRPTATKAPTFASRLLKGMKDAVTFRVFIGKSAGARFFLVLIYVTALFAAAVAVRWGNDVLREARARSLEADVRSLHATAADEYRDLLKARTQFASDFQAATAVPLEDVDPSHRPHELDVALIGHESVREAWRDIHAVGPAADALNKSDDLLTATEARIRDSTFLAADRTHLLELLAAIRVERAAVDRQTQWLSHIQHMINAGRYESAGIQ